MTPRHSRWPSTEAGWWERFIATGDGWRGNLSRLAVLPHVRRRAIAAASVRERERRLRAGGCRRVTALVLPENEGAHHRWNDVGYGPSRTDRYVRTLAIGGPRGPRYRRGRSSEGR